MGGGGERITYLKLRTGLSNSLPEAGKFSDGKIEAKNLNHRHLTVTQGLTQKHNFRMSKWAKQGTKCRVFVS